MSKSCVYTFNVHGWFNGLDFLHELFDISDVLYVQEHWLRPHALNILAGVNNAFDAVSLSAMQNDISFAGRLYDGLAVFYRSNCVKAETSFLNCLNNRCVAVQLDCSSNKVLIFKVYFPCKGDPSYKAEIDIVCCFIESVMLGVMKPDIRVVIAGDFNDDMLNTEENFGMNSFCEIVCKNKLTPCTKYYDGPVKYTFKCVNRNAVSNVDNVFVDTLVDYMDIVDDVYVRSDHNAVLCALSQVSMVDEAKQSEQSSSIV